MSFIQDELEELISSHQSELKKKWNMAQDEPIESGAQQADDVLAKLAEDLKKVGLEDKSEL